MLLYSMPLSKAALAKSGPLYNTKPETAVSSGPFILTKWDKDQQIIFERNAKYTGKLKPQITKIIQDGQQKKLFREVDIPMTVGSLMGTISSYTQAKPYGCQILALGYDTNDETYRAKLAPRLKAHLKQLMRAHLDIRNADEHK